MREDLPPSPRNKKITRLGVASHVLYILAGFCAWKIGGLWGIGLVLTLYIASVLDSVVNEEHRQELLQIQGYLAMKDTAKSSSLQDDSEARKRRSDEDSP